MMDNSPARAKARHVSCVMNDEIAKAVALRLYYFISHETCVHLSFTSPCTFTSFILPHAGLYRLYERIECVRHITSRLIC